MRTLRLGTRGSALALAQARAVAALLEQRDRDLAVELVTIRTAGDERPAATPGDATPDDKSRFVKEIEQALQDGEVDLAVHSAKDVPAELPDGLAIVGVPERVDARDTLVGAKSIEELHDGAAVGTASLRRRAQLLAARSDLSVRALHGNVDTRLRRLGDGQFTAIVLARAGLVRLEERRGTPIPTSVMTPAAGQGALLLEARSGDRRAADLGALLTHHESALRLTAERALVSALGATCRTPVGAHAELADGALSLSAFAGLPDGSAWIRDALEGPAHHPAALGRSAADRLMTAGASELLARAQREGWVWP